MSPDEIARQICGIPSFLQERIAAAITTERTAREKAEAERDETWTDERGVTWRRPTAWAYAQACSARDDARMFALQEAAEVCRRMHNNYAAKAIEALIPQPQEPDHG